MTDPSPTLRPRDPQRSVLPPQPDLTRLTLAILFIVSLFVLRILGINANTTVGYVIYGFFRYIQGLPLLAGAAWKELSRRGKAGVLGKSSAHVLIGGSPRWGAAERSFDGWIDEVRITPRALARAELVAA